MPLSSMVGAYLKRHDLALHRNPIRNCVYQEAAFCLKYNLDRPELIIRQIQRYFDAGYPQHNGMVECGVILRRHTAKIQRFNEAWYEEIKLGSRRDQLSFNYTAHQLGIKYGCLPGIIGANPHFENVGHLRERSDPGKD